jgi:hypothetical protein
LKEKQMRAQYRFSSRPKQDGYLLISLLVTVAIGAILAFNVVQNDTARFQSVRASTEAEYWRGGRALMNRYLDTYRSELLAATPITGIASPLAPTLTELRALALTDTSFGAQSPEGQTFVFSVQPMPLGCVPPACLELRARIWSTAQYTVAATGAPAIDFTREVAVAVGNDGANPSPGNTADLSGASGSWAEPNPLPGSEALVVVRAGFGSEFDTSQFYKVNGSRKLTGNMDANNQQLNNVQRLLTPGSESGLDTARVFGPEVAIQSAPGVDRFVLQGAAGQMVGLQNARMELTTAAAAGSGARTILQGGQIDSVGGAVNVRNAAGVGTASLDGATGRIQSIGGEISANDAGGTWQARINGATGETQAKGRIAVMDGSGTTALAQLTSAGDVTTANGSVVAGGTGKVEALRAKLRGTAVRGSACAAAEEFDIARDAATGTTLLMCSGGTWRATGSQEQTSGTPCAIDGAFAQSPTGVGLICRGGRWAEPSSAIGRFVQTDSYRVESSNPASLVVAAPTGGCGATGSAKIYLEVNDGVIVGGFNAFATGSGPWAISFKKVDPGNLIVDADLGGIAHVGCFYN